MTRHLNFLIVLFVIFVSRGALAGINPLPPKMQQLCAQATTQEFTPSPLSLKSPHPNKLFNLIEMGAGHDEVITALGGKHPDAIEIDGVTPMLMAALVGNWRAGHALLGKGANINYTFPPLITTTPLDISIFSRKFAFACKLFESGLVLPSKKSDRDSLFRDALITLPPEMVQGATIVDFFLQSGFDPNDMGSPLETPLMRAVGVESVPAIQVLLSHGALLDIVKKDGRTVWTVAYKKNNPQIIKLLKQAQKKANSTKKTALKEPAHH